MQQPQKLELIDIYDISYQPWWQAGWFKIIFLVIVVLLAGAMVGYLIKKMRKKTPLVYWKQALASLAALEKEGFSNGQLFYVRLTSVLKDYFHHRYHLPLADKTDIEVLETLKHTPEIPPVVYQEMKEILDGVMFIKFANQEAATERMEQALGKSRLLIETTQQEHVAK